MSTFPPLTSASKATLTTLLTTLLSSLDPSQIPDATDYGIAMAENSKTVGYLVEEMQGMEFLDEEASPSVTAALEAWITDNAPPSSAPSPSPPPSSTASTVQSVAFGKLTSKRPRDDGAGGAGGKACYAFQQGSCKHGANCR